MYDCFYSLSLLYAGFVPLEYTRVAGLPALSVPVLSTNLSLQEAEREVSLTGSGSARGRCSGAVLTENLSLHVLETVWWCCCHWKE